MRILVVGGTGSVGRVICQEIVLTLGAESLVVGDHKLQRGRDFSQKLSSRAGFVEVNVNDTNSIKDATKAVDAVIVAVRQTQPKVQRVCTNRGIPSVDVVPDTPLVRSVFSPSQASLADQRVSGVVGAGLIPGLSGLMVRHALEEARRVDQEPEDLVVNVSLLQRKNGTAGAAGIADMLGLFARPVVYEGRQIRGFTRIRTSPFPEPFGNRPARLVAFPEASDVRAHFGIDHVHYWTAFDDPAFNGTIAMLNRLGILNQFREPGGGKRLASFLAQSKGSTAHTEETVALTVEAGRTVVKLTVPSDYGGTAMAAVAMTRALAARTVHDYGVVMPFQFFTLGQIVDLIASPELVVAIEGSSAPGFRPGLC